MNNDVICFQCGSIVTESCSGRILLCDECEESDWQSYHAAIATLPEGILVRVVFKSGFSEDLTGWYTDFFCDGSVKQFIRWYEILHGYEKEKLISTQIGSAELEQLVSVLTAIDLPSLTLFQESICVTDAASVVIWAPSYNLEISVDLFGFEDECIPVAARAGAKSFRKAWELLDSLSPYSTKTHYK